MRKILLSVWFAATTLCAQTQPAVPEFEVASIKPAPPLDPAKIVAGKMHLGMSVDAARVDIGSLSLADLIRTAYRLKSYQVSGPDWMTSERFDVLAKMPAGASKDKVPEMLQALLAERFKLVVHRDTKEHAVYALVVGKSGPKMKDAEPDPAPGTAAAAPPAGGMVVGSGDSQMRISPNKEGRSATVAGAPFGQMKVTMGEAGMIHMDFARMTMPSFADMLSRMTDRPVVDRTELKGNYQLAMDLSMDEMRNVARAAAASAGFALPMGPGRPGGDAGRGPAPADAASTPGGSSIFSAVQQLGLKLDPRKLPVETLVVDHVEKTPTEN